MELIPRRAFDRGLFPLQRRMNRMFEDFFHDPREPDLWGRGDWVPALDVAETEEAYVISAEVPGIRIEDLDITLTGNMLTLAGEKKSESEDWRSTRPD